MRLPNWKDGTLSGGDERLALPKELPLAVRAQAYMQARQADNINPLDGSTRSATTDFQSPYLIKIPNERWAWSLLYNYADADDLDNTDTIYEGIDINSLTLTSSYYFMRNVKGIAELNVDLLDKEDQTGQYWTGHLSREHYFLFGFDAAF